MQLCASDLQSAHQHVSAYLLVCACICMYLCVHARTRTGFTPRTIDSIVSKLCHNGAPVVDGNATARTNGVDLCTLGNGQAAIPP